MPHPALLFIGVCLALWLLTAGLGRWRHRHAAGGAVLLGIVAIMAWQLIELAFR